MKQKREISRGEKIEVWLDADGSSERYLSKVEDVLDENTIIITRPVAPGKFTYLSLDQVVKIIYFRNEEAYYFDGKVIDRIKYKNSISIKIYAVSKIK
ncbi:MAG TPA: hypothetical protein DD426_04745, partial [Clostridiaceae bacterium]|nr:hypothetical protein [Clostridiaceae bacterium]